MAKKTAPLLPYADELLRRLGERLRLARLRRRLPAKQVAERAGMSPMTLRSVERGGSGVTIGAYLAVMQILGIEQDLDLVGQADAMGRALQDARLPAHGKAVARAKASAPPEQGSALCAQSAAPAAPAAQPRATPHGSADEEQDWIAQSGFTSSRALAQLIAPAPKKGR